MNVDIRPHPGKKGVYAEGTGVQTRVTVLVTQSTAA